MVIVDTIQSLLLIISAILIMISAVGLVSLDNNLKNVVYARIHIIGVFDIACVIALIGLNHVLLAIIYFIVAPFTAHAIANAYFKSEDSLNNNFTPKIEESPFTHSKSAIQELERESNLLSKDNNDKFTISTLEIREDE